jgi:pimeloyl-ACP methyl ester carboxylesterase
MIEPDIHQYASNRLKLSYCHWSNPGAPNLLMVHGGKDHNRNWDLVANALVSEFNIVAPDLRGHGDSDWSPDGCYYHSECVVDLAHLVDHLQWNSFAIIGHSLGATLSAYYTASYPEQVEKLIAIEPFSPFPLLAEREAKIETPAERLRIYVNDTKKAALRRHKEFNSVEEAVARVLELPLNFPAHIVETVTRQGLRQLDNGKYQWKYDPMMDLRIRFDIPRNDRDRFCQAISCPTLLFHGQDSWAKHPEESGVAAHLADVRIESYACAGHWVHHDQLDLFIAATRAFLQS